ncbi:MAG TPA: hypothetical protein VM408_03930 [Methylomirabilota bacterium]|nr:hypothetical protein [Methylomirabilota bacterium]
MDEADVRARAEAMGTAVVAGDIEAATTDFSAELRQNLGEVIALLPLPATSAVVESIERGGPSAFVVVLLIEGETETVQIETRWKEREGRPTVIEVGHLSSVAPEPSAEGEGEGEGDASGGGSDGSGDAAG